MKPDDNPKQYDQQVLEDYVAAVGSLHSSSSPESQITVPPTPPYQFHTAQNNNHSSPETTKHSDGECGPYGAWSEPEANQGFEQALLPSIEAVFDGACEPRNPGGHGSYGSIVRVNGQVIYSYGGYCGHGPKMSNNVAEYCGAIDALTEAVKHKGIITLKGDSKLVIMQLGPDSAQGRKRWKAKGGLYLPYYKKAFALVQRHRGRIRFQWVRRENNAECDELSKDVLRGRGIQLRIQPERGQRSQKAKRRKVSLRRSHKRKGATDFNPKGGKC